MSKLHGDITGVILVGGKSRRMGRDKTFLEVDGVTLFDKILDAFRENFLDILLVGDRGERFANYSIPICADIFPGSSLGGLYTGLHYAKTNFVFVASCDLPYPSSKVIDYLCRQVDGSDAVVPKLSYGYEPLFAAYSKTCLSPIRRMLEEESYCVYDFYPQVKVKAVTEEDMQSVMESPYSFINLNTPAEYENLKGKK